MLINLTLIILMILIAFTGWRMISISKKESFSNVFTKITVTLGIVMAVLYFNII